VPGALRRGIHLLEARLLVIFRDFNATRQPDQWALTSLMSQPVASLDVPDVTQRPRVNILRRGAEVASLVRVGAETCQPLRTAAPKGVSCITAAASAFLSMGVLGPAAERCAESGPKVKVS
jgi:hypothetical protein